MKNRVLISYWWVRPNGSNTYIEEYCPEEILDNIYLLEDLKPAYMKLRGLNRSDISYFDYKIESAPKFEAKRDWLESEKES